jgi:hypothetical protein
MSILITQFVAADIAKSLATGVITAPSAGTVPTADGSGHAVWLPSGAGVRLQSAGGDVSLVDDGEGPALAVNGLTPGPGINLALAAGAVTVTNSDPGSAVSLASAGGDVSLVDGDGAGPALAVNGLTPGTGINLALAAGAVTVSVNPADLPFVPTAGGQMTGPLDMFGSQVQNTGDITTINTGTATIGTATLPYRNLYMYNGGAPGPSAGLPVGLTKFRQWALQTVNNTITDTSLIAYGAGVSTGSPIIPANTLVPGSTYSARVAGVLTFAVTNASTTFRFRIGATIVTALAFFPTGLNGASFPYILDFDFVCSTAGATGAGVGSGCLQLYMLQAVTALAFLAGMIDTGATAATIDTTIANTIDIAVQHGINLVGTSATARYVLIKRE